MQVHMLQAEFLIWSWPETVVHVVHVWIASIRYDRVFLIIARDVYLIVVGEPDKLHSIVICDGILLYLKFRLMYDVFQDLNLS